MRVAVEEIGRSTRLRNAAVWLIPLVIAVTSFCWGIAKIGTIEPGVAAESVAEFESQQILAGRHRYGIVDYTHYPNGPTYVQTMMRAFGLEAGALRLVPIALAGASLGFLLWAMLVSPTTLALRIFAIVACIVLLFQPGIAHWQGALHEHSYALALAFAALACACVVEPGRAWIFFALGFAAGWIGYDFIPVQAGAVFTGRWLYHAQRGGERTPQSLRWAFVLAGLDGLRFASGACAAVIAHIVQLGLYFGGLDFALRDLLGSAAERMGAESAAAINPAYHARFSGFGDLEGVAEREVFFTPGGRVVYLIGRFFAGFAHAGAIAVVFALGLVAMVVDLRARLSCREGRVAGVALATIAISSFAWLYLMPRHAMFHFHILPRHLFVTYAMCVVLLAALGWSASDPTLPAPPAEWRRRVFAAIAVHALAPTTLVLLGTYTWAAFG